MKTGRFCKCGKEISPDARRCRKCYSKKTSGKLSKGISRKRYKDKLKNE